MSVDQELDLTEKKGWDKRPERVVIPAENGLELTEIRDDDFGVIEELYTLIDKNRQHIGEFAKDIKSESDLVRQIHDYNRFGALQLAISNKDGGAIIGEVIRWDNEDARWDDTASLWVSYWVDKDHTRQGNVSAAVRALSKYSFAAEPGLERMLARVKADSIGPNGEVVPGNRASMGVLTKAGFRFMTTIEKTMDGSASIYELSRESFHSPTEIDVNLDQSV